MSVFSSGPGYLMCNYNIKFYIKYSTAAGGQIPDPASVTQYCFWKSFSKNFSYTLDSSYIKYLEMDEGKNKL